MKIVVDQEGRNIIQQLCDIALKQAGLQNLNAVNKILNSIELLPVPVVEEKLKPKSLKEKDETTGSADAKKQEEKPKEEVTEDEELSKEEVVEEKPKEEVAEG